MKVLSNVSGVGSTVVWAVVSLVFLTVTPTFAAQQDDVEQEVKEAASAIQNYSVEQKDEAVARAEEMIEDLDDKMHVWEGRLKEKWDDMKESSKEKYEISKESLKKQREELSAWRDKMQNSSADAWGEVKKGFSSAYDSFVESWEEADKEMDEKM